jgi:hypothetical protein
MLFGTQATIRNMGKSLACKPGVVDIVSNDSLKIGSKLSVKLWSILFTFPVEIKILHLFGKAYQHYY